MHVNGKFTDIYSYVKKLFILAMLMGLGSTEAWTQEPVVITTDTDNSGAIEDGEKKLYMIQTNYGQSFYIVPQSNNTITTNNILGDYMLWYFLDAGKVDDTQYYYIVNNSTGKYIYNHNGNDRGISIISSSDFASLSNENKEKCKFKFVLDESNGTTGFYNIDVKANQTYCGLNKQGSSQTNTNPIRLTNNDYIHDINSKWKFIPYNGTFTWPTPPFTISTDLDIHYYKIRNVQKNDYFVSTDATPDKVTYSKAESNSMVWYFKEAPSDPSTPWFKYYYIVNPKAEDKYMYYSGTATNGSNQTNAVSVKAYDSNDEDRFQFMPWISFVNLYGKKYGLIELKNSSHNDNIYSQPDENSQILGKLNRPQYIRLTSVEGIWALSSVLDLSRETTTGYIQWRNEKGLIYLFPNIK